LIKGGNKLYLAFSDILRIFERTQTRNSTEVQKLDETAILIGAHRMGKGLIELAQNHQLKLLAIDYDPVVVRNLQSKGVRCIYGDISDPELLDTYNPENLKVLISTVPGFDENIILLGKLKELGRKPFTIVRAGSAEEARQLEKLGADYVLVPEYIAGDAIINLLKENEIIKPQSK
jgi:Trk K+ transport system NAD-binding subunit